MAHKLLAACALVFTSGAAFADAFDDIKIEAGQSCSTRNVTAAMRTMRPMAPMARR